MAQQVHSETGINTWPLLFDHASIELNDRIAELLSSGRTRHLSTGPCKASAQADRGGDLSLGCGTTTVPTESWKHNARHVSPTATQISSQEHSKDTMTGPPHLPPEVEPPRSSVVSGRQACLYARQLQHS
eukprot:3888766-Rhodomonas_salina.9